MPDLPVLALPMGTQKVPVQIRIHGCAEVLDLPHRNVPCR